MLPVNGGQVRHRFNVINATAVPIVRAADEQTKALVRSEAVTNGAGGFHKAAATQNGRISTHAAKIDSGALPRGLGDEVHGAADAVAVHVGLQGLIDFHRLDDVRGNGVKFDLANIRLRRRNVDAVDSGVGKARLGSANLHVLALAFVAFYGYAGQTAKGVGHVGVGQAADYIGGENLYDVIGGDLAVDGLGFAGGALGGDQDFKAHRLHFELGINTRGPASGDIQCLRKGFETDVRDGHRITSRIKIIYEELTTTVRRDVDTAGLDDSLSANQCAA